MSPQGEGWFKERPRMKRCSALLFTLVGLALGVLSSCGGTNLSYVWKDPHYGGGYLTSVMVVGVSKEVDRRRVFEEVFVREFEKRGIKAVASIKVLDPDTQLTRDTVKAQAARLRMDAVLTTRLLSAGNEEIDQPPSISTMPSAQYRNLDLYFYSWDALSAYPGALGRQYVVRLETNVFDTDTEKLIWTASSQTVEPESIREIIESLCKNIMDRLRQDKLLR
jgi:hypothetical protein